MSWRATWTPEMEAALRAGFAAGLSASQIALAVAPAAGRPMTRNMVIGKLHRLGLSSDREERRAALGGKSPAAAKPGRPRHGALVVAVPLDAPLPAPELIKGLMGGGAPAAEALLGLAADGCRWPVGDPASADFHFCGAPRLAKRPYCGAHCKQAVSPVQPRPVRAPSEARGLARKVSLGAGVFGSTHKGVF
jgi:GcrA cell cycle regulator